MTSQVMVESSVMLRIELKILPIRPSGTSPEAWHVPTGCGALTTVVLRDQQLLVLSGFLGPESAEKRVITTLTPYVIWDDTDLDRLFECKSNRSDASQEAPPK